MQVSVLASGSKGNAVYVEVDGTRILVDAGISATRIKKALAEHGVDAAVLDGVLVTHEHGDHVNGLPTLLKWYHLPVYGTQGTFRSMSCASRVPKECLHRISEPFQLGNVRVEPFSIPHDAAEPVGYRIRGSENCTVATDLGFVTSAVQSALEDADVMVLEANHDPEILKNGSYPWALKRRILSNQGHLANSEAAWALARLKKRPKTVFLAHLSEENNRPSVARNTVQKILEQQGIRISIEMTSQTEAASFWS